MEKSHSRIVSYSKEAIKEAADLIKAGKLVGFPTETVYGLGANALDKAATTSIFTTKGIIFIGKHVERPMNDPLIVHVDNYESAIKLVDIDEQTKKVYKLLAETYWPGPLTIVTKANDALIPPTVTAGTGCVGIRCPNHKVLLFTLNND
jgi:L-threonylcarbamoyladenylate synthase